MQVFIHDRDALLAIKPSAVSAYARASGWTRQEPYRQHSDVYTGENQPEIIIPRTDRLGDYASIVSNLIKTFSDVGHQDETSVYRALVTADRDVVCLRVADRQDGSIVLDKGVNLINGARDILLAAACSMDGPPKSVYRVGANRTAKNLLERVRLGQTDQGSYVVTLLMPIVPPPIPTLFSNESDEILPVQRLLTVRLMEALAATRLAVERTVSGDGNAFREAVTHGVSANLCEALAQIIESFPTLDINVSWAQTLPVTKPIRTVLFGNADVPLLQEAGRSFRAHAPRYDVSLHGYVQLLNRGEDEMDGRIRLNATVDHKQQSVTALSERQDYERAVEAHKHQEVVILSGDLERMGQRWRLFNPRFEGVLRKEADDPDRAKV